MNPRLFAGKSQIDCISHAPLKHLGEACHLTGHVRLLGSRRDQEVQPRLPWFDVVRLTLAGRHE